MGKADVTGVTLRKKTFPQEVEKMPGYTQERGMTPGSPQKV